MLILNPEENGHGKQGPESTLVHELIHLKLWAWDAKGNLEDDLKEAAIETLAKAFMELKYGD